jgi:pilus assembly protein CpaC
MKIFPLIAALLAIAAPAVAQPAFMSEAAPGRAIFVPRDKSASFTLSEPATKIVVAQPDTAQVVATSNQSFYVRGKELGATNLLVYGPGGRLKEVIDVRVGYDAATLQQDLAAAFPTEKIAVRNLGEGLLLSGDVSNTSVANRAKALADRYAPDAVTSAITVRASQQVVLEVRVLEATRSVLKDIGLMANVGNSSFSFASGTGLVGATAPQGLLTLTGGAGSTMIDVQLQALEQKGLIRTLARPNLVALSGEKASFLAGGEYPYPVPQGRDQVTLEFRPYGVKLDFQPLVQDNGLIRLAVQPEVSQLDPANSLRINNVTVPGLIVRRTGTVVELKNGDSLAIGGLFQREYANTMKQVPGLGDIPVLSALFRSTQWRRNETELMILVTPRLATAADMDKARDATIAGVEPDPIGMLLQGKSLDKPMTKQAATERSPS